MAIYEQSAQQFSTARSCLAGGVSSSLRASMKPVPLYAAGGKGSRIWDVDGNQYIDYLLAYGPLILGHAHDGLIDSTHQAMAKGFAYGIQHEGEIELARLLCEVLPCADKVSLSGSGTEAVMLALRLARAYTGKTKVVRFHGHYHGWSDSIFTSFPSADMKGHASAQSSAIAPGTNGQSSGSLADVILLPWNDKAALESVLRDQYNEIAAVISEPVMCNSGCILPEAGYLELMRALTAELNIVMILDEVITGFRLGLGGAQQRLGVTADLVTVGKALGGGIAISAVGGIEAIMKQVDDGRVSHLGTLNGNGVSTAAAIATIRELARDDEAPFRQMEQATERLVNGFRALCAEHEVGVVINQIGPVFNVMFTDLAEICDFAAYNTRDSAKYAKFAELMLDEGVLVRPNGLWYLSTAHSEADVADTLTAIAKVLPKLS